MAVSLRDPQDGDLAELSEINVTPFIDVMLVLLIIFMVAAPLSTVDVAVDLPVSSVPPQARPDKPIFLSVKPDLTLALGNDDVPRGALQATLDRQTNSDRQQRIFLRADGAIPYEGVMQVMGALNASGFRDIGLVTEQGGPRFDGQDG